MKETTKVAIAVMAVLLALGILAARVVLEA